MWYQQAQGLDMVEAYNRLLQTFLPDLPLETFHRQMGLPDLTDDEAFEGLDDYVYGTLARLYREVYQEDPLQSERKRQMNKKVAISGLFLTV